MSRCRVRQARPLRYAGGPIDATVAMPADDAQQTLIRALQDPARYPHAVERVEHRETHISHVLLAGEYAYKIKKPLDLGFLDFSTLARRRFYCEEEVRLNGRLAPSIYLDVVAITGTPGDPVLGGEGAPIEYAVRMRRFPESGLLDRRLRAEGLEPGVIDEIVRQVGAFHERAPTAGDGTDYGTPAAVVAPMRDNFEQLRPRVGDADERARVERLAAWTEEAFEALRPALQRRRADGRVRECHGDMHLGNMALVDDGVAIFDGIEFNAHLRWIDVASEIAFLVMDLDHRGAPGLAGRALDGWLAATGDYDALAVLRLYLVYRALVRAKIAAIRLGQAEPGDDAEAARASLRDHLGLAARYATASAPAVLITRGISGSGKSTAAAELVARIGAVRLRSDVERRRLYPDPDPASRYSAQADAAVYARLEALAARTVESGFPAIVDATFLERERRAPFARLAAHREVPFRVLDLQLPAETAARRVEARARAGADPSEADRAVALAQRERLEPLDGHERACAVVIDNSGEAPVVPATGLAHARGFAPDG